MKNKTLQKTLIGLLLLAVFFSPRFGGFRAQDFLLVLSILVWVVFRSPEMNFSTFSGIVGLRSLAD